MAFLNQVIAVIVPLRVSSIGVGAQRWFATTNGKEDEYVTLFTLTFL